MLVASPQTSRRSVLRRTLVVLVVLTGACNADERGDGSTDATVDIPTFTENSEDVPREFAGDSATDADAARLDDVAPDPDADAAPPDTEADPSDAPTPDLPGDVADAAGGPDAPRDVTPDAERDADVVEDVPVDMRACDGISCDPRIPGCEGARFVTYGEGECVIADDGIAECRYEGTPVDCAAEGASCSPDGCTATGYIDLCIGGRSNTAHACALHADGRVFCWGDSEFSQLGPGSTGDDVADPVVVPLPPIADLACGGAHVCALDRDGLVWCWGANGFGQIGGDPGVRAEPATVPGTDALPAIVSLEAGNNGTLARTVDGEVYYWGALGVRNVMQVAEPTLLASEIDLVSAGRSVVYLASSDAPPTYIGSPGWSVSDSSEPTTFGDAIFQTAAGGWDHSCGIGADGSARCWGRDQGRSGDETPDDRAHADPVDVSELPRTLDLAVSSAAACAVIDAFHVWCWGIDGLGTMGRGRLSDDGPQSAREVHGFLREIVQVEAGWDAMFARSGEGRIYSWGGNESLVLGPRADEDRRSPSRVLLPE